MGGTTKIEQPTPPAPPSATSTMTEYIQNYPRLFELQQQYAPQEAAMQVGLAEKYAGPLGRAYKSAQEGMYPEETKLTQALNAQIMENLGGTVPDWMRQQYLSNLRANLGTNIGSPIGADYTSQGLLQQQQDWQNYYRNLGLSITGRQPIAQATSPGYTNQLAGYNPQAAMGYAQGMYSPYMGAYSSMYGANTQSAGASPPWMNMVGTIGGSFAGGMGQSLGNKWFK